MRMPVRRFVIVSALLLAAAPALAGPPATAPVKPPAPSSSASAGAAPSSSASAAGPAQAASEIDTAARQLFLDAITAYESGDNAKAYELLLAAWKVKQHWQIAASLGAVEMAVGKPVDAANHFTYYLREAPADRREKATKLLGEAVAKVGTITVTSEPSDVEIVVDGVASGAKSGQPLYVTADDRHVVTVRRGEQSTDLELIVGAGKTHEARVVLEEKKARSHLPSFVLGGVGLAAVITGAVLTGVAQSNGADLQTNAPRRSDGQLLCRKAPTPASAATPTCDAWRAKAAEAATMGNVGIGMFAVAGVAVAGALVWELLPSRSKAASATIQVIPVASVDGAGALVRGRF